MGNSFFTIIDPLNQAAGSIPASWFLDEWARFKGIEYYVGGVSAAEMHGAAHQRPQVFQIVVNRSMRPFSLPSEKIVFLYRRRIVNAMWEQKKVPTGYFRVSTPEMTAYDLLALRKACPSLNRVATIYVELGEVIRTRAIARLCDLGCETAILQRVGWLLDHTGWDRLTGGLFRKLDAQHLNWVPLHPGLAVRGTRSDKWRVIENTDIQPDIEPRVQV